MLRRNKKKKEEHGTDESWLLPYADMLTLLLALFIVLFAMSELDVKKFEKLAQAFQGEFTEADILDESNQDSSDDILDDHKGLVRDDNEAEADDENEKITDLDALEEYQKLKQMQKEIDEYIGSNSLQETLGTKLTADGLLISVRTDVTFDSGSATVKKEGKEISEEISNFLKTDPPHEIVVNGHADDRPMHNDEFASNWELSTMRAIQFMYLLLDDTGLNPEWFSARGYGEYQPVVKNTNEKNRAINRRVEVLIEPNFNIEEEVEDGNKGDNRK